MAQPSVQMVWDEFPDYRITKKDVEDYLFEIFPSHKSLIRVTVRPVVDAPSTKQGC